MVIADLIRWGKGTPFTPLVGQTVREARISADAEMIAFQTDSSLVAYRAVGDCCSDCWFSDINGATRLLGQTVIRVEDKGMAEEEGTRQEADRVYAYTIVTQRGHCDLELRNSSNGYYGGWCELTELTDADWDQMQPLTKRFRSE